MRGTTLPPLPKSRRASSLATRTSMRGNRSVGTKPEAALAKALDETGVVGFAQNVKHLPGSPDIAFEEQRLAIFMHGCFWHRCPHCSPHMPTSNPEYWMAKFARNKRRDALVRARLRRLGWRTLVVWECQVKKGARRTANRIAKTLGAARV